MSAQAETQAEAQVEVGVEAQVEAKMKKELGAEGGGLLLLQAGQEGGAGLGPYQVSRGQEDVGQGAGVLGHPRPHAAQRQGGRCHGGLGGGRQQGEDQGGRGVEEFGSGHLHPVEDQGQGGQQGSADLVKALRF